MKIRKIDIPKGATSSISGVFVQGSGGEAGTVSTAEYAKEAGHTATADRADKARNLTEDSSDWDTIDGKDAATLDAAETYTNDHALRKDIPDTAQRVITFLEGIALGSEDGKYYLDADGFARLFRVVASSVTSSRYTAGDEGIGYSMWEDADGTGNLTIDNLKVRKKMTAAELEVRKKTYTSGNLSLGKAGNTIFAVKPFRQNGTPIADMVFAVNGAAIAVQDGGVTVLGKISENETPAWYRCYFLRTDGERTVDNCWEIGDQAKCQTSNLTEGTTHNAANRYYWRLVVGKGTETLEDGREYHYVDLSNEEAPVVDIPLAIKGEALAFYGKEDDMPDWDGITERYNLVPKAGDVYLYAHEDGAGTQPEVITYTTDTEYTVLVPEQDDIYRTADGRYYRADLDYNGDLWIETTAAQQVLQGYDTSADNDAPMTGDDIAQEGSQTDKDRQGLMVLDSEEGISKYRGINGFTYEGKRRQHIGDTVELEVNRLTIVSEAPDGTPEEHRVPCYMGAWTARPYPYYSQVDCDGSIWLCTRPAGATVADRPHDGSAVWHKQVSKGESIDIKGSVPNASALPSGAQDGDCYITDDDGHLHRYQGGSWRDLGQLKGLDGHPGADAEFYRLVPVTERAVVGRGGKLTATLSYRIEHVKGSSVTAVPATADLRVRYRGSAGTPASTGMSTGDTPSASYVLEDYPHVPHPDYLVVELVDAEETVHDRRTVPVTFSTTAALDINGQVGEISARVQGMAEDAEAYMAEVKVSVGKVDASVTDMKTGLESAGVHIDGEKKSISLNGDTTITGSDGQQTALFKDGKITADHIDANHLEAEHVKLTEAEISGKVTSREGYIGPFEIGNDGFFVGDYSKWTQTSMDNRANYMYMNRSSLKLEQWESYAGILAADIKVGLGRGSDPSQQNESSCSSAMYVYRKMAATYGADLYFPAAQIVSENVLNRDIGLRVVGGLQVHGGLMEKGAFLDLSEVSLLDFSFGTTFLLYAPVTNNIRAFYPTLSQIREQLGIKDTTEPFCVPFKVVARRGSAKFWFSSQKYSTAPPTSSESGIILDNNGNEWELSTHAMASGDVAQFVLCYTPATGYYCQLISYME